MTTLQRIAFTGFLALSPLFGQTGDQDNIVLKKIAALESRIKELEESLAKSPKAEAAPAPAAAPVAAAQPAPAPAPPPMEDMDHSSHDGALGSFGSGMQMRGFGDIQYRASNDHVNTNSFLLGQFDLFMSSRLSEKWNFIAESVIQADAKTNSFGFEIERLMLQYKMNDYLNLSFGRYHAAIGYYNTAFHHGTWFQTAVGRPKLFAFEDEGGILPIHDVGVAAEGRVPSGKWNVTYIAEIGNGRASRNRDAEYVQNVFSDRNRKAVNVGFYARPEWMSGWQFGASMYVDKLAPDNFARINQKVMAGHLVYNRNKVEFLNEVVVVGNGVQGKNRTFRHTGFYSQVSKGYGMLHPYFRYEYLNVNERDPLFYDYGRSNGPIGGLRWDAGEYSAFKIQYGRMSSNLRGTYDEVKAQLSFAF